VVGKANAFSVTPGNVSHTEITFYGEAMWKNRVVYGIYRDRAQVEQPIDRLRATGFRSEDISVLLPKNVGTKEFAHEKHSKAPEGTATGATVGGFGKRQQQRYAFREGNQPRNLEVMTCVGP
jgi:hypothetical protein